MIGTGAYVAVFPDLTSRRISIQVELHTAQGQPPGWLNSDATRTAFRAGVLAAPQEQSSRSYPNAARGAGVVLVRVGVG